MSDDASRRLSQLCWGSGDGGIYVYFFFAVCCWWCRCPSIVFEGLLHFVFASPLSSPLLLSFASHFSLFSRRGIYISTNRPQGGEIPTKGATNQPLVSLFCFVRPSLFLFLGSHSSACPFTRAKHKSIYKHCIMTPSLPPSLPPSFPPSLPSALRNTTPSLILRCLLHLFQSTLGRRVRMLHILLNHVNVLLLPRH